MLFASPNVITSNNTNTHISDTSCYVVKAGIIKKNKPANHQLLKDFAFGIEKILDQLAVAASAMGVDVYSESKIY